MSHYAKNKQDKRAMREKDRLFARFRKLKKYFKIQVSGESLKHGKPYPDIFLATAKKLKINPKNILVIEDSRSGVIAAKRAGMKCIGLKQP